MKAEKKNSRQSRDFFFSRKRGPWGAPWAPDGREGGKFFSRQSRDFFPGKGAPWGGPMGGPMGMGPHGGPGAWASMWYADPRKTGSVHKFPLKDSVLLSQVFGFRLCLFRVKLFYRERWPVNS